MRPERILSETREVLPPDAIITTDVGWNKNGVGQQFDILTPGTFLTPGGFATMGFGAPAAVGAKIAHPDRVVVSLVGDGGFGQNPAVLATAREENVAVVWVVMNNNAFGTIAGLEKAAFDTTYGTVFGKAGDPMYTDYAAIAEAYGVRGIKVDSAAEFKPALERAIALGTPVVIDVSMVNVPTPTTGHWNIMDIYSPGETVAPRGDALTRPWRAAGCGIRVLEALPLRRYPGRGDHAMPSGFRPVGISRLTDGPGGPPRRPHRCRRTPSRRAVRRGAPRSPADGPARRWRRRPRGWRDR